MKNVVLILNMLKVGYKILKEVIEIKSILTRKESKDGNLRRLKDCYKRTPSKISYLQILKQEKLYLR